METVRYVKKPWYVDAVRVTEENMEEIAAWAGGEIRSTGGGKEDREIKRYIKVHVHRAMNQRQTKAFVGDWVLKASETSFKVYTNGAFLNDFSEAAVAIQSPIEVAQELGIEYNLSSHEATATDEVVFSG